MKKKQNYKMFEYDFELFGSNFYYLKLAVALAAGNQPVVDCFVAVVACLDAVEPLPLVENSELK